MKLALLARRAIDEHRRREAVFDLPCSSWYQGAPDLDLSVSFHGRRASTPLGPKASPQSQLAQNIVLSWLGGGRIIELQTVQAGGDLTVPGPSIDAANLCFTVARSRGLSVSQSLEEYVKAWMLIAILRAADVTSAAHQARSETLFDLSIGCDLTKIRTPEMTGFIRGMMDATPTIDRLRGELTGSLAGYRDLDFSPKIATSVTLSTAPDESASEVEAMGETLLRDLGVGLTIKLDPRLLGHDRVCAILHDRLGYQEVRPVEAELDQAARWDQLLEAVGRLTAIAQGAGQTLSVKLAESLVVHNHRHTFPTERQMFLSGPPLFPINATLALRLREALGAAFPVSFCGGIDEHNVAAAVSCGLTPVTLSAALLRPDGYGRLSSCLEALERRMGELGTANIPSFIMAAEGAAEAGFDDQHEASLYNLRAVVERAIGDPHYERAQNSAIPRKIGSSLVLFDCISCDKCVSCCPNDANFTYETESVNSFSEAAVVAADGAIVLRPAAPFVVERTHQLACWADFCNECGNCDVLCPEDGGPQIAKPHFFGSLATFDEHAQQDGIHLSATTDRVQVWARINRRRYQLDLDRAKGTARFSDGVLELELAVPSGVVDSSRSVPGATAEAGHRLSTHPARAILTILSGVLGEGRPNPVNAALLDDGGG